MRTTACRVQKQEVFICDVNTATQKFIDTLSLRKGEVADRRDHFYSHHVVEYGCLRKGEEVVRSMDELIY